MQPRVDGVQRPEAEQATAPRNLVLVAQVAALEALERGLEAGVGGEAESTGGLRRSEGTDHLGAGQHRQGPEGLAAS